MSKYIDLAEQVIRDRMRGPITGMGGEAYSLAWLDSHPDQVPGRTMTEVRQSEMDRLTRYTSDMYKRGVYAGLLLAKAKIVGDPEPTNAERWEKFICDWMDAQDEPIAFPVLAFTATLDAAGIKAPEANDD